LAVTAAALAISESLDDTTRLAAALAAHLDPGDVICLSGQLGAGKTYFTKGLVGGLGGDPTRVTSPTFVLMQIYGDVLAETAPGAAGLRMPVYHFDAYRLTSGGELVDIGSDDALDGDGVTVIEWADRVADALPPERFDIRIESTGAERREFHILGLGRRLAAIVRQLIEQQVAVAAEDS
jgi:tRNA threonylcarbamoyladenosine biosynthesis protein TsaE